MNFDSITTAPCVNVPPPPDSRCEDPAFALANPDICPVGPQLIIKPSVALTCALGSIQYKAYLVKNGSETELTTGVIFATANPDIAIIGAVSGNATGVVTGETSITATYNGQTALANMTVLDSDCCAAQQVAMMVVVDNSKSMSQVFGGAYPSKLHFARAAASSFISGVNEQKDLVGLMRFNALESVILAQPDSDKDDVAALVPGIQQSQQLTTFFDALTAAIGELDLTAADRKVIVLISDGEDTSTSYANGENPLELLSEFKASGGIVLCLGVRASGKGYNLLSGLSTGGFFINAYGTNAANAIGWLNGLKGYICAGNCTPEGDSFEYRGVSNYTGFANWDVIDGQADILGNGFFDVLPGNGLYVDLIGSPNLSGDYDKGTLRSKDTFSIVAGRNYRIALDLAGNQVVNTTDHVRVTVRSDSVTVLQQDIYLSDYRQGFTTYAFNFAAPADMDVLIEIVQLDHVYGVPGDLAGVLLGRVRLSDTTNNEDLLDDDFDTENATYIAPRCGAGTYYTYYYGYVTGYNCYGEGCLDEPPPAQAQDPNPLSDIESGFPPPLTYTSTRTACASCNAGFINLGDQIVPVMTSATAPEGVASASNEGGGTAAWNAFDQDRDTQWATDPGLNNQWVQYKFASSKVVTAYQIVPGSMVLRKRTHLFQGSLNGTTWTTLDTISSYLSDSITFSRKFSNTTAYTYYRLTLSSVLTGGSFLIREIMLFEDVAQEVCKEATATSELSQSDADTKAYAAALALAQAELNCVRQYTATEQATATCAYNLFPVTRSATATSLNSIDEAEAAAQAAALVLAEAARDCTQSTNGQPTTINDNAPATPYPSVQYISGVTGLVTKVELNLFGLTHFFSKDILMVLRAPSGETCCIMANAGAAPFAGVNLVIKDDAATVIPASGTIASGSYKPTNSGGYVALPAPGPAQPHGLTLATFIGISPLGQWALFILDDLPSNSGTLASWSLTITAA